MEQTFSTEELKEELERKLGFRLRELTRLDGASALNFKAVRATDGMPFAVKCSPPKHQKMFDHLVQNLRGLEGSKAVHRLFERELPPVFRGYNLLCTSWCEGVRIFPDRLTDDQFRAFLDDYLEFSAAMQKCVGVFPLLPLVKMRIGLLTFTGGMWRWLLRLFVDREIPEHTLVYRDSLVRTVHSDFHHGNFLFVDGRVNGYLDLEEFRKGYPAEDLIRYLVCAAEHLRWYELQRGRRICARFAQAVRQLPYSRDEWLLAINSRLLVKVCSKLQGHRIGPFQLANLFFKARFYRRLKSCLTDYGI